MNRPLQHEFNDIYQHLNWAMDVLHLVHGHAYCDTKSADPNVAPRTNIQPVAPPPLRHRGLTIPIEESSTLMKGITRMKMKNVIISPNI